jgi:hypothetical protein
MAVSATNSNRRVRTRTHGGGLILGPVDTTVVVVPEKLSRIGPLMFTSMVFPVLRFFSVTNRGPAIIAVLLN